MPFPGGALGGLFKPRKRPYLAACEYWAYLTGEELPNQEILLDRMVKANPYNRPGKPAIEAKEGIVFTDIRLHMALVLRSKNPHVFRPDLFHEAFEPSAEALAALSHAHSLVKLRYVSEQPLADDRHLQFMPHLAAAILDLGGGLAVYDVIAERLFTPESYGEMLEADPNVRRFENHVRTVWTKGLHSGNAATKGLVKKGLPELQTDEAHLDQQVLVREVVQEAAKAIWTKGEMPETITVRCFEDEFELQITAAKTGPYKVRILRMRMPA